MRRQKTGGSQRVRFFVVCVTVLAAVGIVGLRNAGVDADRGGSTTTQAPAPTVLSGSLYIVDSAQRAHTSQVLLVDVAAGTVIRRFSAGHMPDAALSPDGRRLYVTSSIWQGNNWMSSLETYDTVTGHVIATADNPDDVIYTMADYPSRMKMSPSGRWIYILKNQQTLTDNFYLAVFDTAQNRFLPVRVRLFGCNHALFLPARDELHVNVVCSHSSLVREVAINPTAADAVETSRSFASSPSEPRAEPGAVMWNAASGRLAFVTKHSRGLVLDRASPNVRKVELEGRPDRWIRMQTALMAGDVAYLATGQLSTLRAGSEAFNQIVKVDANTFETRETLDTTRPFYSMSLSSDGNTIYTVSPERGIVTAVDTRNLTQIREIHLEGHWPVFAISAPR